MMLVGAAAARNPNKRLQRTGISVPLIDNLSHDVVVSRPLKRSVRCFPVGAELHRSQETSHGKIFFKVELNSHLLDVGCSDFGMR
jgi:hypothetical protein